MTAHREAARRPWTEPGVQADSSVARRRPVLSGRESGFLADFREGRELCLSAETKGRWRTLHGTSLRTFLDERTGGHGSTSGNRLARSSRGAGEPHGRDRTTGAAGARSGGSDQLSGRLQLHQPDHVVRDAGDVDRERRDVPDTRTTRTATCCSRGRAARLGCWYSAELTQPRPATSRATPASATWTSRHPATTTPTAGARSSGSMLDEGRDDGRSRRHHRDRAAQPLRRCENAVEDLSDERGVPVHQRPAARARAGCGRSTRRPVTSTRLTGMGRFSHEQEAYASPGNWYLTDDRGDARFIYRFDPDKPARPDDRRALRPGVRQDRGDRVLGRAAEPARPGRRHALARLRPRRVGLRQGRGHGGDGQFGRPRRQRGLLQRVRSRQPIRAGSGAWTTSGTTGPSAVRSSSQGDFARLGRPDNLRFNDAGDLFIMEDHSASDFGRGPTGNVNQVWVLPRHDGGCRRTSSCWRRRRTSRPAPGSRTTAGCSTCPSRQSRRARVTSSPSGSRRTGTGPTTGRSADRTTARGPAEVREPGVHRHPAALLRRCLSGAHRRVPGHECAGRWSWRVRFWRPSSTSPGGDRGLVSRPRLSDRLSRGGRVGADARVGAGRVRQDDAADGVARRVAGSRSGRERSAAWLSLDLRDNDPALFWRYLVAALDAAAPGVGANALALLQSAQPPTDAVLATLLNDLDAVPDDVVLVLDDFHVIDAPEVQDGMAFLLEHLPRTAPPGDRRARRPGVAAGAAAGAGRARRGPRRRPALHAGRGRGLPQRRRWDWP